MRLFSWLFDWFSNTSNSIDSDTQIHNSDTASYSQDDFAVNPATGLPMVGGMGGVDVHGNPFGMDLHDDFSSPSSMGFDDGFTSSSWDD